MDGHNMGRGRISPKKALGQIKAKTLVIGVESDLLFPVAEQKFISQNIPGAKFTEIKSVYGHDGFLLEQSQLIKVIQSFYK